MGAVPTIFSLSRALVDLQLLSFKRVMQAQLCLYLQEKRQQRQTTMTSLTSVPETFKSDSWFDVETLCRKNCNVCEVGRRQQSGNQNKTPSPPRHEHQLSRRWQKVGAAQCFVALISPPSDACYLPGIHSSTTTNPCH